jgi:hypothetical protein
MYCFLMCYLMLYNVLDLVVIDSFHVTLEDSQYRKESF